MVQREVVNLNLYRGRFSLKNKKTFFYIGGFELPDKNAAAHRVLNIGKILRKLGYNVVFIGISNSNKGIPMNKPSFENIEGFDSWYISYPRNILEWIKYATQINYIKKIVGEYKGDYSFICYNYQAVAFYKIIKFSQKNNIKVLSDTTEWYGSQGQSIPKKIIKSLDTNFRMKILNKKVDGLIAISNYLYNYYNKSVITINVPPLVDKNDKKWSLRKEEIIKNISLVYAGSPGKTKDKINNLIRSLINLPKNNSINLKIVGITRNDFINLYPEEKENLNLINNNVEFLGRKTHQETLRILSNADFSIFFRENNRTNKAGFPTKFVESLSCGVPVVTNSTSNIDQYLFDGINGYMIDDNDISSTLNKILKTSQADREHMKQNINPNEFDYNNFLPEFESFLNNIDLSKD